MLMIWRRLSRGLRSKTTTSILVLVLLTSLLYYFTSHANKNNVAKHDKKQDTHHKTEITKTTTKTRSIMNKSKDANNNNNEGVNESEGHINPYPFNFTMSSTPCTDQDLVIVVHSAVQYHKRRMLMRYTWLNQRNLEKELALKIKIVFVTGWTNNFTALQYLDYEQEMYGDIIQSDFIDSYQNNTYKAISFLRWVSSEKGCPNASLVLKVDDDALIHPVKVSKLNRTLHKALNTHQQDIYLGRLLTRLVNRNNASKWYISYDLWPEELYPVWFQGLVYVLTPHLAAQLYPIALDTRYMFTDDVYMGILVSKVKGAHVMIENMIGIHTEEEISTFEGSFKNECKIFYHVPSLEYFFKWYNLNSDVISVNPVTTTKRPRGIKGSGPAWIALVLLGLLLITIISIAIYPLCKEL